jgi:SAM-dependent methyltransferase
MRARLIAFSLFSLGLPGACAPADPVVQTPSASVGEDGFPAADRPVADIVTSHSGPEAARDAEGEAERTMAVLPLRPGVVVADIGAGDGYFTVRLARRLAGEGGEVIATDVVPGFLDRLRGRIAREGHANVTTVLGGYDDPRLPPASVDVALMVRMYHEIGSPYAFLWRLRDALRPGAVVAVSERDRPSQQHGMPPALLRCEFEAVGFEQVSFTELGGRMGYVAVFAPTRPRPEPTAIQPCAAG